jgi:hypothetical protein
VSWLAYIERALVPYCRVANWEILSVSPESRCHGSPRPRQARTRAGCPATGWQHLHARHKPEETPLHPIIEEHAPRYFAELREQGASLPRFVQAEFEHYLRSGQLEHGFIRVK